jgi:hypothetical protein
MAPHAIDSPKKICATASTHVAPWAISELSHRPGPFTRSLTPFQLNLSTEAPPWDNVNQVRDTTAQVELETGEGGD